MAKGSGAKRGPEREEGERLVEPGESATLAVHVRGLLGASHSVAKEVVEAGRVLVDDELELDPVRRPAPGSRVSVRRHPAGPDAVEEARRARASTIVGPGFRLVHVDDAIVAADKEPGVVVIPTSDPDPEDPPLVARVVAALGLAGLPAHELYVVHRIDRETSGLVLFARSERAYGPLRAAFRHRAPRREYLAWTEGIPRPAKGELVHRLEEGARGGRMRVVGEGAAPSPSTSAGPGRGGAEGRGGGRARGGSRQGGGARGGRAGRREQGLEARLTYEVERTTTRQLKAARLRVRLVTGRRNQIRVQLAASGTPILGDRYYGARNEGPGRTALHAALLSFTHPLSGEELTLESPLPEDLAKLDRRLFGG